ncbi:MAG: hypothetical protein IJW17_03425 [Lentisphaeria bacterium]|nr:hypothetical protein [Lentisphaeria bacterium]
MKKICFVFGLVCAVLPGVFANDLKDPGFENGSPAWKNSFVKSNAAFDSAVFKSGKKSLCFNRKKATAFCGYSQEVKYDLPSNEAIIFGGFAKAENVVLEKSKKHDFSFYLDIYYADGTATWAQRIKLPAGTWDWKRFEKTFYPDKPVTKIRFYVFLRDNAFGKVWFDELFLSRAADQDE